MGFWDSLGEGLKNAGENRAAYDEKVANYMNRYQNKSTDELMKQVKRASSTAERVAIKKILDERR
ncbi:hypothetical protein ON064_03050 [Planococcus sp. A6]|uniref:hypothetical protein n=1 Tax=Planococcus sp. A6 TaxID=2992760 RepID=UPI00237C13ED|nr:hypothetical protein [Planococcus sp. A6]MDE0582022.1 hypothetical protein [Planococcus sp. A6]